MNHYSKRISLVLLLLTGLISSACSPLGKPIPELASTAANPFATSRPDPLVCPVLSNDPTQAQLGSVVYCQVCMACHGDVGQGLDQWRTKLQPPDDNCFTSKCHGVHHPPWGFLLPENLNIPAIIGPGLLDGFGSAQNLHDYLQKGMPWWNPGYLKADEYWQLIAFLLEANGIDLGATSLDAANAAQIIIKTK